MPAARIEQAAEWWGTAATGMLLHARGIEQQIEGHRERARRDQPRPGHGQVRQAGLRRLDDHRPGQRPGRPRARPQVRPAPGQPRHHATPSTAPTSPRCGAATRRRSPARASPPRRSSRRSTPARSRGCCRSASTPPCRRPTRNFTARGARPARVLRRHRLLPVRVRPPRRRRAPGLAARGGRGHRRRRGEGRIVKINPAVDPPGEARRGLADPARPRRPPRAAASYFPYTNTEQIFEELRLASAGRHRRLPRRHVAAHRGRDGPVLAGPRDRPSGHAAAVRGRRVLPPRRQGPLPRRARSGSRPRSSTTSTRSGSPPGGSSASTCRARRPGASPAWSRSTPSRCARSTRGWRSGSASRTATSSTVTSRRGSMTLPAHVVTTIRPDTVFIPYHWPGAKAANQLTNRAARPDCRRCPSSRSPRCGSTRRRARSDHRRTRLDLQEGP